MDGDIIWHVLTVLNRPSTVAIDPAAHFLPKNRHGALGGIQVAPQWFGGSEEPQTRHDKTAWWFPRIPKAGGELGITDTCKVFAAFCNQKNLQERVGKIFLS